VTTLYLRYRARMLLSFLKPGSRRDWGYLALGAFLVLVYGPIIFLLYATLQSAFAQVAGSHGVPVLQRLLYLPATAHSIGLLFLILNRAHPALLESADGDLLRSLPLSGRTLAQARMSGLALSMAPVALLLAPLLGFYAHEAEAGLGLALWIVLLLALYLLLLVGVGCTVTGLLARTLSPLGLSRLSKYGTLVVLVPMLMSLSLALPNRGIVPQLVEVVNLLLEYADRLRWLPGAWVVRGVGAASAGALGEALSWSLLLAAGAGLLWWAGLALVGPLMEEDRAAPETAAAAAPGSMLSWAPSFLSGASRALWRREFSAVLVEAPRALLPIIPLACMPLLTGRSAAIMSFLPYMLALMALIMVSTLCLAAVGQEGQAFWILRTLPVPMWRVLMVKLAVRLSSVMLILVPLATLAVLFLPAVELPFADDLLVLVVPLALVALAVSGVWSLATGARFPVFKPTRKGQYVGVAGSLCGVYGAIIIFATTLLSLLPMQVPSLRPLLWFLPIAVPVFWLGVSVLFLTWALWHLEHLE
jgi:hypothetical protein